MIITGFTNKGQTLSKFVDDITQAKSYNTINGDFIIDLSVGDLIMDVRSWIVANDGPNVAAFYGDYIDQNGDYGLQACFPSPRGVYPGILFKGDILRQCNTSNPLDEIATKYIISYIPQVIFRINA